MGRVPRDPPGLRIPRRPARAKLLGMTAPRFVLALLALPLAGCIENRVSVELFTQIHGDGTCTRRVEYRLERVDTNKGDARVEIRPEDDVLARWHRFPSGEPWQVREERETGLHVIVLEALLPSPAAADGDFFRARAPRAQPARNSSPPSSTPSTASTSTRRCSATPRPRSPPRGRSPARR